MLAEKEQRPVIDASLLRAIVDQFVERSTHPLSDLRQFEKLALGLIDIVDADTVARICRPLCSHPETPLAIFERLLEKGGACAELAFEFAPVPAVADMRAAAEQGGTALAVSLARRRDLTTEVIEALAARSEPAILRALAGNAALHFDAGVRRALALAARDDATLARLLLDRKDFDIDPEPLFLAATRLERMAIVLEACRRTLAAGAPDIPRRADPVLVADLEEAARRRRPDDLAALLAGALGCRKDRARALLGDSLGDALALALCALGLPAQAATRIFLCADPVISHDTERVRALIALLRSTPRGAAMRIVLSITGAPRVESEGGRPRQIGGWRRYSPRASISSTLDKTGTA